MLPQMHMFSTHVQKLVLAAECLMFHDVTPQSLNANGSAGRPLLHPMPFREIRVVAIDERSHERGRGVPVSLIACSDR
ncbi:MAG: hypothetical protein K0S79_1820 [Nitrospira sp.]|nr:hypothetical protein [Nitrospira sp.]